MPIGRDTQRAGRTPSPRGTSMCGGRAGWPRPASSEAGRAPAPGAGGGQGRAGSGSAARTRPARGARAEAVVRGSCGQRPREMRLRLGQVLPALCLGAAFPLLWYAVWQGSRGESGRRGRPVPSARGTKGGGRGGTCRAPFAGPSGQCGAGSARPEPRRTVPGAPGSPRPSCGSVPPCGGESGQGMAGRAAGLPIPSRSSGPARLSGRAGQMRNVCPPEARPRVRLSMRVSPVPPGS